MADNIAVVVGGRRGDPAAHLPDDRKGVLGPLTPRLAQNIRAFLKRALG